MNTVPVMQATRYVTTTYVAATCSIMLEHAAKSLGSSTYKSISQHLYILMHQKAIHLIPLIFRFTIQTALNT